jgi:hypothetical protein
MATYPDRAHGICDAILNKIATAGQMEHLGKALAYQAGALSEYNVMTSLEKAIFLVTRVRSYLVTVVKQYDQAVAAQLAMNNAAASVDSEFTEG